MQTEAIHSTFLLSRIIIRASNNFRLHIHLFLPLHPSHSFSRILLPQLVFASPSLRSLRSSSSLPFLPIIFHFLVFSSCLPQTVKLIRFPLSALHSALFLLLSLLTSYYIFSSFVPSVEADVPNERWQTKWALVSTVLIHSNQLAIAEICDLLWFSYSTVLLQDAQRKKEEMERRKAEVPLSIYSNLLSYCIPS